MSKIIKYVLLILIALVGITLVDIFSGSILSFWIGFLTAVFMDIVTFIHNETNNETE